MLQAQEITVQRRGRRILARLSLTVPPGEALLVAGPNGAGKTTLLRALAGISEPSAGRLCRPAPPRAYLPEKVVMAPGLTVAAWLASMRRLRRAPAARDASPLEAAGLEPRDADRPLGALSKGQLQRVVLAEAVSCRPRLLVCDEPFAGLDGPGRVWLAGELRALLEAGAIVVVTDHSGAAEALLPGLRRHVLGGPGRAVGGAASPVRITAVDPDGRRIELSTTTAEREARLRELLHAGWAIEEVRSP